MCSIHTIAYSELINEAFVDHEILFEQMKAALGEDESLKSETVAQAYVEHYALKLFSHADTEDRAARHNKLVTIIFEETVCFIVCFIVYTFDNLVNRTMSTSVNKISFNLLVQLLATLLLLLLYNRYSGDWLHLQFTTMDCALEKQDQYNSSH